MNIPLSEFEQIIDEIDFPVWQKFEPRHREFSWEKMRNSSFIKQCIAQVFGVRINCLNIEAFKVGVLVNEVRNLLLLDLSLWFANSNDALVDFFVFLCDFAFDDINADLKHLFIKH